MPWREPGGTMSDSRLQPKSRVLMMPRDTNPAGTIFGGVILSYIDQAGAEEALEHGAGRVVTVAMKEVVDALAFGGEVSGTDEVINGTVISNSPFSLSHEHILYREYANHIISVSLIYRET